MDLIEWKIGVEFELLAPNGKSRKSLAIDVALDFNGYVEQFNWFSSDEYNEKNECILFSIVPGFIVFDSNGDYVAKFIDDCSITVYKELNSLTINNWNKIVSNNMDVLREIESCTNLSDSLNNIFKTASAFYLNSKNEYKNGICILRDKNNNTMAIASPLNDGREKVCEIVTSPIDVNHYRKIDRILSKARNLKFLIPTESATHLHFDATSLCEARVFSNLIKFFWSNGENIKLLVGVNKNCKRLGPWDKSIFDAVNNCEFNNLSWEEVITIFLSLKVTKMCDFNIKNIIDSNIEKFTFEVRVLPGLIDTKLVIYHIKLFESILKHIINQDFISAMPVLNINRFEITKMLKAINLPFDTYTFFISRLNEIEFN